MASPTALRCGQLAAALRGAVDTANFTLTMPLPHTPIEAELLRAVKLFRDTMATVQDELEKIHAKG